MLRYGYDNHRGAFHYLVDQWPGSVREKFQSARNLMSAMVRRGDMGAVRKFRRGFSLDCAKKVVRMWPLSIRATDDDGCVPLHRAFSSLASNNVMMRAGKASCGSSSSSGPKLRSTRTRTASFRSTGLSKLAAGFHWTRYGSSSIAPSLNSV
jgi:hypothetical protein